MREEFEKMAAAGKLEARHIETLVVLTTNRFCMHRSWGFGKITAVDTLLCRFLIDFQSKKGHSMDLAFAAESLKPIPQDHILARKVSDLDGLRRRTRVMNGRCQGFYCGAHTRELLTAHGDAR